jgi:hypothetical protein
MTDLITMWACRAPDPCPTCGAASGAPCALGASRTFTDGEPVHGERIESHPVAAALGELSAAARHLKTASGFETLVATAVVAVAELVAHDQASREVFFGQLAAACERAGAQPRGPTCTHGVVFDAAAARGLSEVEIRRRWPRLEGLCPLGCGFCGAAYASLEHYLAGWS